VRINIYFLKLSNSANHFQHIKPNLLVFGRAIGERVTFAD
jgi:hypothetical protein